MSARSAVARRRRRATPSRMLDFIRRRAVGAAEPLPCHWVDGSTEIFGAGCDEGTNFCRECCEKKVAEILESYPAEAKDVGIYVGGGWSTEHDGPARCETCGARLDCSLTDYGFDEELEAVTRWAYPTTPDDWDLLYETLQHVAERYDESVLVPPPRPTDKLAESIYDRWLSAWRRIYRTLRTVVADAQRAGADRG